MTDTQQIPTMTDFRFVPDRTRYKAANAVWLANIANCVYDRENIGNEKILKQLNAECSDGEFRTIQRFDKDSSQAMVIEHERFVVAAFRGTDELADWLDNLHAAAVRHPLGSVHVGFRNALMDVWPAMRAALRGIRRKRKENGDQKPFPLWLTGHSLGGALATLAAAELIATDVPFYGVYTFGQPRCGDREFARTFNQEAKGRFFRFQNNNDIVTRLPSRAMGYSHVGTFVYISSDGTLDADVGLWYQFLDAARGIVKDIGDVGLDAVEDHDMNEYLRAILKWGNRHPQDLPLTA